MSLEQVQGQREKHCGCGILPSKLPAFVEGLEFAEGRRGVRVLCSAELRLSKLKQTSWCWWQKVWPFRAKKVSVYRFVGTEEKSWCIFLMCCCSPSPRDVSSKSPCDSVGWICAHWTRAPLQGKGWLWVTAGERLDMKYRLKSVAASQNFPQVIGVLGEGHQNTELFKMHVTCSVPSMWPWRWQWWDRPDGVWAQRCPWQLCKAELCGVVMLTYSQRER